MLCFFYQTFKIKKRSFNLTISMGSVCKSPLIDPLIEIGMCPASNLLKNYQFTSGKVQIIAYCQCQKQINFVPYLDGCMCY